MRAEAVPGSRSSLCPWDSAQHITGARNIPERGERDEVAWRSYSEPGVVLQEHSDWFLG